MKIIRLLGVLVVSILFIQAFSHDIHAQERSVHGIIVQYHEGQTPEDISRKVVTDRIEYKSNAFGSVQHIWEVVLTKLQGKELPQDQLARIETVERSSGVVEEHELFVDDPDIKDSYLLTLEKNRSAEDAADRYRSMPEVESAEPAENLLQFGE